MSGVEPFTTGARRLKPYTFTISPPRLNTRRSTAGSLGDGFAVGLGEAAALEPAPMGARFGATAASAARVLSNAMSTSQMGHPSKIALILLVDARDQSATPLPKCTWQLESLLCSTWAKPAAQGPIAAPDAKIMKHIGASTYPDLSTATPIGPATVRQDGALN